MGSSVQGSEVSRGGRFCAVIGINQKGESLDRPCTISTTETLEKWIKVRKNGG